MLAEKGLLGYIEEDMCVYRFGVGCYSGTSKLKRRHSELLLYSCLTSYLSNDELKKIMLKRQFDSIHYYANVLEQNFRDQFRLYYRFKKYKKYIKQNFMKPLKILKTIIRKSKRNV